MKLWNWLKHPMMNNRFSFLAILTLCLTVGLTSCYRVPNKIEPQISYAVQDRYIRSLDNSFPSLDEYEKKEEWGKEYQIGVAFAKNLDLYRAVTAFKRAEILIPNTLYHRKQEVIYYVILCYYLGQRYDEALDAFEDSGLGVINTSFPTYHDLLVILYESYLHSGDEDQADQIMNILRHHYPETAKQLLLSTALTKGTLNTLSKYAYNSSTKDQVQHLVKDYSKQKKSITKAQLLNAAVPGAGYFYVGQKQSALTAVLLNGLFIASAYAFFHNGYTAAGIITSSFEAGWYFGGIYGAGEAAKLFNERVYESRAFQTLHQQELFPVFRIQYGF